MSDNPNSREFDPYREWLGIPPGPRPPSPEVLLGVSPGETDNERILDAAMKQKGRLDGLMLGKHSQLAAELTKEVSAAMSLLLERAEAVVGQPAEASEAAESTLSAEEPSIVAGLTAERSGENGPRQGSQSPPLPATEPAPGEGPADITDAVTVPTQFARPRRRRATWPWRAVGAFSVPFRLFDRLLLAIVGEENDILHNFLRVVAVVTLMTLVGLTGKTAWPMLSGFFAPIVGNLLPKETPAVLRRPLRLQPIIPQTIEAGKKLRLQQIAPQTIEAGKKLRLQPITPQTIEAGKKLTIALSVEDAQCWHGNVRFILGGGAPPGAYIDLEHGTFTWTPTADQGPRKYDLSAWVEGPDGQRAETTFTVTVTKPTPLHLEPIAPQTIEVGRRLALKALVKEWWEPKVRFSLGTNAPTGTRVDPETGAFTWTPTENQGPGMYDVDVSVVGPDGRKGDTTFSITVTKPSPPAREGISLDLGGGVKAE